MKTICPKWSVLALVLGTSAGFGCSSDTGETGPGPGPGPGGAADPPAIGVPPDPGTQSTPPQLRVAPDRSNPVTPPVNPGSHVVITGIITDLGGGLPGLGLGGDGMLANAKAVRLSQLSPSGELKLLVDAKIDASGNFSAQVPLNIGLIVAQVLDVSGKLLGSVIVGGSGSVAGNIVVAAPITTETSIEAQVLLGACACQPGHHGQLGALGLSLDVAALVDAKLVAAVLAAVKAGIDVDVLVKALAVATVGAARARVQALVDAGVTIDIDAFVKAKLAAIQRLNVGLTGALAGQVSLVQVTSQLLADLDAALGVAAKLSANVRVRAQVAANLAFSATLAASLRGVVHANAIVFAAIHAAAKIEAQIAAVAVVDILKLAGATQTAIDVAVAASAKLKVDVDAAVDVRALTQARLDFLAVLSGGAQGRGGLLGDLLVQTTGNVQVLVASVLDTVAKLSADLDAKLKVQSAAIIGADVCVDLAASVDLDATLHALVKALAKFTVDVQALGPSLQTGTTTDVTAAALADLLATVQILLRLQP
jgi:hypothetical protein